MAGGKGSSDKGAKARAQDKARHEKAKAAEKREADRKAGQKADEAIRNDPNRRHPW